MSIDAVLPAAGRISGEFAEESGVEVKALIPLGGETLLERTVAVLRACEHIGRVVVVGPKEVADHPGSTTADAVLPAVGTSPENILRGFEWLRNAGGPAGERVLVVTTDLPFVTSHAVCDFLDSCSDADVCVPLVGRQEFEARFPGARTSFVPLRDGEWTLGCAFLVNPEAVLRNLDRINGVFHARKSQLGMARILGFRFLVQFLMKRLTVEAVEARCRSLLGCSATAVTGASPDLAFDLDSTEEYQYAKCIWQSGSQREM